MVKVQQLMEEIEVQGHERPGIVAAAHVDDPIGAGEEGPLGQMWKELGKWVLLKVGPRIARETPVKFLGREYVETEHGYKTRMQSSYFDTTLATFDMQNCKPSKTVGTH